MKEFYFRYLFLITFFSNVLYLIFLLLKYVFEKNNNLKKKSIENNKEKI